LFQSIESFTAKVVEAPEDVLPGEVDEWNDNI